MIQVMKAFGVDTIFTTTDEEINQYIESLTNDPDVETILCLHEQSSVAAADGYTNALGMQEPGVAMMGGAAGEYASGLVMTPYSKKRPVIILGSTMYSTFPTRSGQAQMANQSLFDPFVKWSYEFIQPEQVKEVATSAYAIAMEDPKSPVLVNTYMDVLESKMDSVTIPDVSGFQPSCNKVPGHEWLTDVAKKLTQAKFPVIAAGEFGSKEEAVPDLVTLAETLSIPVVEVGDRMSFPSDHPLHMGFSINEVVERVGEPDVVLSLDTSAAAGTEDAFNILVDPDPISSHEWYYTQWSPVCCADMRAEASSCLTVHELLGLVRKEIELNWNKQAEAEDRRKTVKEAHNDMRIEWEEEAKKHFGEQPISPQELYKRVSEIKEEDTIYYQSGFCAGVINLWDRKQMHFSKPGTFLRSHGKVGFLGVAPFGAIGIKAAKPNSDVITVIGDGDARWGNIADACWTASHHDKPVLYIIEDNHQLTTTKRHQVHVPATGYNTGNYWAQHLVKPYMNFANLADGSDVWAKAVKDPANLKGVLEEAFQVVKDGEPALVDVWTRPLKPYDHAWPGYDDYPNIDLEED